MQRILKNVNSQKYCSSIPAMFALQTCLLHVAQRICNFSNNSFGFSFCRCHWFSVAGPDSYAVILAHDFLFPFPKSCMVSLFFVSHIQGFFFLCWSGLYCRVFLQSISIILGIIESCSLCLIAQPIIQNADNVSGIGG